jgi:nonribosomal peptide synthetase protein BlmVIII
VTASSARSPASVDVKPIAVIAMAGRFPGANTVEEFWTNLCAGVESISHFSIADLLERGHEARVVTHPRFVGAEGVVDGVAEFDAAFFGYSPREAELMDPQHRLLLESAWEVFDIAGYDPAAIDGSVGVFASTSLSSYLVRNLLPNRGLLDLLGGFPMLIHNDKDFLPTTISYKLGLNGPSMAVGTACSSSLVAAHLAMQSLLAFECDLALAGGVSLQVPAPQGYVHTDDGIYSPDGHCRAFDARAAGTVGGSGVGVVLLKRWADAVRDRDHVHAVLLGSAVNNDGARRAGYTAPGVDGQMTVITEAHEVAGVTADAIGYVEAHGTGTRLGDLVEIDALSRAFRRTTDRRQFCAVGSVKTNIGHLDAAAGVAALIKTVLAVERGTIPASLHYEQPNPQFDLPATPFYVNDTTRSWPGGWPRTAGVSAFGIGGTNAHVVVGERPSTPDGPRPLRPWQPLVVSARDEWALEQTCRNLGQHLDQHRDLELADVAFSLAGRRAFPHRRALVCSDAAAAAAALTVAPQRGAEPGASATRGTTLDDGGLWSGQPRPVVLLLPGQGADHPAMAADLYRDEPAFRVHLDACAAALAGADVDLLGQLGIEPTGRVRGGLTGGTVGQVALYSVEYALARTLLDWGLSPAAMVGHGLGEYVAATLAGVLPLADALRLLHLRGRLFATLAPGRMLAVASPWTDVRELTERRGLSCAADNGPGQCVVAGLPTEVEQLAAELGRRGIDSRLLPVEHAYHSAAMDPLREEFLAAVTMATLQPPALRYVSSVTGRWVTGDEVVQPDYWFRHMRETVQFSDGLRQALALPGAIVLDVGPSATLTGLARRHPDRTGDHLVLACQPRAGGEEPGAVALLSAVARAWVAGAPVNWHEFHSRQRSTRVPCPPYPFDRQHYWIDAPRAVSESPTRLTELVTDLEARARDLAQARPVQTIDDHPQLRADLDQLCTALAYRYLADSTVDVAAGSTTTIQALRSELGVLAPYQRLLDYLVGVLAQEGWLHRDGDSLIFLQPDATTDLDPERVAGRITRGNPQFRGLVDLLLRCGRAYHSALSTPGAALGVLYPDGRGDLLRRALGEQTAEHLRTGQTIELVAGLVRRLPATAERPLRILEVGAGGGRLTWAIAQAVTDRPVQYLVTDIGPAFVDQLAKEAEDRHVTFIRTAVLDIARDAGTQGRPGPEFDLIIGLDVVHATSDVRASLSNLRSLLAPAGILALIETTAGDRWQSMIWGLSADWWSFADDLRTDQPLLTSAEWAKAVAEAGFADSAVLPPPASEPGADTVLVLAQTHPESGLGRGGTSGDAVGVMPSKRPDPRDWLYLPTWTGSAPPSPDRGAVGTVVAFASGPLGLAIAGRLRQRGVDVATVSPGSAFGVVDAQYTLDPARRDDYRALLDDLVAAGRAPSRVVHLWGTDEPSSPLGLDTLDDRLLLGLHSLLFLSQAHGACAQPSLRRIIAVTSGAQEVLGGDLSRPDQAMVNSAVKVIPREFVDLHCTAVDLPTAATDPDRAWLVDRVVDEVLAIPGDVAVAYRGRRRWKPAFTPSPARAPAVVAPGGVYLITGGLGGIGLALAEHLARRPSTVVLIGRRPFPHRTDWDDLVGSDGDGEPGATIRRLIAAENAGGHVRVLSADVTDKAQMQVVVDQVVADYGKITGVIHAAGVADHAGMIQRRTQADTEDSIAAKVRGTLVLDRVLDGHEPDFLVLCSSLGPILYNLKFGEVGYVAGNEFLNAFAAHRSARGKPTISVSWTDWLEAGMWARARKDLGRYELTGSESFRPDEDLLRGISNAEGVEVFGHVLANVEQAHLVVSTQDLHALLARHEAFTTGAHRDLVDRLRLTSPGRRSAVGGPHLAPSTPEEVAIAGMWEALLGVDGVGADDSFFDLGGDSLLALRLLSLVRERFGVDHPIARMFDAPTVRALAADVARALGLDDGEDRDEVLL